jgi:hypothetical protein
LAIHLWQNAKTSVCNLLAYTHAQYRAFLKEEVGEPLLAAALLLAIIGSRIQR